MLISVVSLPSSYSWLDESDRAVSFHNRTALCDGSLVEGWHRFGSPAGTQMITSPLPNDETEFRCRTFAGSWLDCTHTSTIDGEIQRRPCFAYGGNPCLTTTSIKVVNCGSYYLYYLYSPSPCASRYCGSY